jgi:hypothetical protein
MMEPDESVYGLSIVKELDLPKVAMTMTVRPGINSTDDWRAHNMATYNKLAGQIADTLMRDNILFLDAAANYKPTPTPWYRRLCIAAGDKLVRLGKRMGGSCDCEW